MSWLEVDDYTYPRGWKSQDDARARGRYYCEQLEAGRIPFFARIPFDFPEEDRAFLLSQKQSGFRHHKNVSYRPTSNVLRGASNDDPADTKRLQNFMRDYSSRVTEFISKFLNPYANKFKLDYASFRPLEEEGRDLPVHKRNDLAHVDAFPSRPTHGGRILRCFTNINPTQKRVWNVADPFDVIAPKFAERAGLSGYAREAKSLVAPLRRSVGPFLRAVGLPDRTPYDRFMLHFHDYLKENDEFQKDFATHRIEFPPFSTWMVYTDSVPHAVLSGQFALEQTFIVPVEAMVTPQKSPLRVLEELCGTALG